MGDYNAAFLRDRNAAVQGRTKAPNRANVLQLKMNLGFEAAQSDVISATSVGVSTTRPPYFNGKYYSWWKNRMDIFIKVNNYSVWQVIQDGDFKVTKLDENSNVVEKPLNEFTNADYKTMELNYKATNVLMCGLGFNEYKRIMRCKSAKQIWNLLEVTHEGTNELKRSKNLGFEAAQSYVNSAMSVGASTTRPPLFNGKYYSWWKNRMEIFIKANDYRVWQVIQDGDFKVTKLDENSNVVEKPLEEFTNADYKTLELNYKATHMLMCGLGFNEYNRIMRCKSAKQIWNLLEVTHEGTNGLNRSKIELLVTQYELFQMEPSETITQMVTRFTNIVNELDYFGKSIQNEEQVRKILRILPTSWMPKLTSKETKDFKKFSLEELIDSLMTHEIEVKSHEQPSRMKKGLALKVVESDSDEEENEENLATLFKWFCKNYKGMKGKGKAVSSSKGNGGCFECGSRDHMVKECPKQKKQVFRRKNNKIFKQKKQVLAAWGDSDEDSEEEEEANLCLMANEETHSR